MARPAPQGGCRSDPVMARISWRDNAESEAASRCILFWHRPENRTDADSKNRDSLNRLISLKIPVDPPYIKYLRPALNEFNLLIKNYYMTGEVCKVLNIKPDTFRDRLSKGHYSEPKLRIGGKRRFTETEIREILNATKALIRKGIFMRGKD